MSKSFLLLLIGFAIAGCSMLSKIPNPAYAVTVQNPAAVSNPTAPQFIIITNNSVSPIVYTTPAALASTSNTITEMMPVIQTIASMTPAAPMATMLPSVANGILGLVGAGFAMLAAWKNKSANDHAAAAAALAATVVQSGQQTSALANSVGNKSTIKVAEHLASAASTT
jgi:hypothetical protein